MKKLLLIIATLVAYSLHCLANQPSTSNASNKEAITITNTLDSNKSVKDTIKKKVTPFNRDEGLGVYAFFGEPAFNGGAFKFHSFVFDIGFPGYDAPGKAEYDYAIPHSSYKTIASKGDGVTFNIGYALPIIKNTLEFVPSIGVFVIPTNYIDVSTSTGWTYKNREESETNISYGAMLVCNIYAGYDLGVRYNNVTGFSLVIGLHQFIK